MNKNEQNMNITNTNPIGASADGVSSYTDENNKKESIMTKLGTKEDLARIVNSGVTAIEMFKQFRLFSFDNPFALLLLKDEEMKDMIDGVRIRKDAEINAYWDEKTAAQEVRLENVRLGNVKTEESKMDYNNKVEAKVEEVPSMDVQAFLAETLNAIQENPIGTGMVEAIKEMGKVEEVLDAKLEVSAPVQEVKSNGFEHLESMLSVCEQHMVNIPLTQESDSRVHLNIVLHDNLCSFSIIRGGQVIKSLCDNVLPNQSTIPSAIVWVFNNHSNYSEYMTANMSIYHNDANNPELNQRNSKRIMSESFVRSTYEAFNINIRNTVVTPQEESKMDQVTKEYVEPVAVKVTKMNMDTFRGSVVKSYVGTAKHVVLAVDGSSTNAHGVRGAFAAFPSESLVYFNASNLIASQVITTKSQVGANTRGEVASIIVALKWAISQGYTSCSVVYDYTGIEKWVNGDWAAKQGFTQQYREFFVRCNDKIAVEFIWTKGHTAKTSPVALLNGFVDALFAGNR